MDDESKGQLVHCFMSINDCSSEPMFFQREDGTIVANLVDKAIVPLAEYRRLREKAGEPIEAESMDWFKQLYEPLPN